MRVLEIMTEGVTTAAPELAASEAWELMHRNRVRHLVVVKGGRMVGLVSERDFGGRAGAAVRSGRTVADLMTSPVVTVGPDDTVRSAANVMRGRTIGCVPVVKGRKLLGIVTVSDLLDLLGHWGDRPSARQRAALNYRVPHRKQHRAAQAW